MSLQPPPHVRVAPTHTRLDEKLEAKIDELSRLPVLLVGSDYDGTLSEIVTDPTQAHPHREAVVALRALAGLPRTHVAVISGRALADLAHLLGNAENMMLVGSHGSEFDLDFATSLDAAATRLRAEILDDLNAIAADFEGAAIEEKPASIALHYRNAASGTEPEIVERVLSGPARRPGAVQKRGKMVFELAVVSTDKGHALSRIRHRVGASGALFLGDDVTDESAFETLTGPDLGIKVGDGESRATLRVTDPEEVSRVLAALAEKRERWLEGSEAVPIEKHSLLSDLRTVALVEPDATVTWMCAPRIDSAALFARLVGGDTAGYFSIRPVGGGSAPTQRYLEGSLVLETTWDGVKVIDYLDASDGRPTRRAGRTELIRRLEGAGRVRIEFAPRLDFGRTETVLSETENGLAIEGSPDPVHLFSPGVQWKLEAEGIHTTATAEVELDPAHPLVLELRYGASGFGAQTGEETHRLEHTLAFWRNWLSPLAIADHLPARELVQKSALVLKALCHGPTGGIAAAATTSLPEHIGGVRNWDYRYVWLRDAAMTAEALVLLDSRQEAMEFLDWVLEVMVECSSPGSLRPLYSVSGRHLGSEAELSELSGYAGSRPVRVGNGAATQIQLDVFGPVVQLISRLAESGAPLSGEHWRLVESMVQAVAERWHEPDHGIWEIRGPRRHHVHSKVMCWLTVDRAIRVGRSFLGHERPEWVALAEEIKADVLEHGWNEEAQSFTTAYGETAADAAVLTIGLYGLIEKNDPRFVSTVEAIERELREGATVYRYLCDDGLPGREGGFHICAMWLVESYLAIGRTEDARELFDAVCACAGPTGLLSEEYDPRDGRALGNHPQAYSHLGLISAALKLAESEAS